MSRPSRYNLEMAAHLAKPVNNLDSDIQNMFPDYDQIKNYKSNSQILDKQGQNFTPTEAIDLGTDSLDINRGSRFPKGIETNFPIPLSSYLAQSGTQIQAGRYINFPINGPKPKIQQEIQLNNFTPSHDMSLLGPDGYLHNFKSGTLYPHYILPANSEIQSPGINPINHPEFKLDLNIELPHYIQAGTVLEGPFVSSLQITGEDSSGNTEVISPQNPLQAGQSITVNSDVVLLNGSLLMGKVPIDVVTSDFTLLDHTNPPLIPAGVILKDKEQEVTLNLSITTPAILTLESQTPNDINTCDPVRKFKSVFLSNSASSIYSDESFDEIKTLFDSLDSTSTNVDNSVKLIELKAILHLLTSLKSMNDTQSAFTDTNLVLLIARTRDVLDEIQDQIDEENAAEHSDDFGEYIEKEQGITKYVTDFNQNSDEIKNELQATSNKIRESISGSLNTNLKITDDIDENKASYEQFKTSYAKEAMSKGMDVITDRLDQIFEQATEARTDFLDNTWRGKAQKKGAAFKKLGFWKKVGGFAAVSAVGVALGAATGIAAVPLVTAGALRLYGAYAVGGFMKDRNKQARTHFSKARGKLGKANAVEMEYFLRSLPDTEEEDNLKEYQKNVSQNRKSQRTAMNKKVKSSFNSPKYKSRIKALKNAVESAKTPEESKTAMITLKLAYTEIMTEILEDFYQEQVQSMISTRRSRGIARTLEYGAGFGLSGLIKFLPDGIKSIAETIKSTEFSENPFSSANLDVSSRFDSAKGAGKEALNFFGISTAEAAEPSSVVSTTDSDIKLPFTDEPKEVLAKATDTGLSSPSTVFGNSSPQTLTVPSDSVARNLFGDKDPGLSKIINYISGTDLSTDKVMEIAKQIASENSLKDVNVILDGQELSISDSTLDMIVKNSGASKAEVLSKLNKLS